MGGFTVSRYCEICLMCRLFYCRRGSPNTYHTEGRQHNWSVAGAKGQLRRNWGADSYSRYRT